MYPALTFHQVASINCTVSAAITPAQEYSADSKDLSQALEKSLCSVAVDLGLDDPNPNPNLALAQTLTHFFFSFFFPFAMN